MPVLAQAAADLIDRDIHQDAADGDEEDGRSEDVQAIGVKDEDFPCDLCDDDPYSAPNGAGQYHKEGEGNREAFGRWVGIGHIDE